MLVWIICGALAALNAFLLIKLLLVRKSIDEIRSEITSRLSEDTNNLIYVSSNDKNIRRLAGELNAQLTLLRKQRIRYQNGDRELKEAITNVSHDLRTPLTAISGYLELLDSEEKSVNAERYISIIRNRVETLAQLTDELLRYSIISSGEKDNEAAPVDMRELLEESISSFYSVLKKRGIEPIIITPEQKVIRILDRQSLLRVYSNLLSNAVKYSDGDLSVTLSESGRTVFYKKSNEMSETEVGKLFDRFYTVESARRSTGLGLAIARTLVERMKGEISAEYRDIILSIYVRFPSE